MLGRKLHFDVKKYCVFKIKIKNDIITVFTSQVIQ